MKIAFVWDWDIVPHQAIGWQDGLAAAIKELSSRGNHINVFAAGEVSYDLPHPYFTILVRRNIPIEVRQFDPDVVLIWGDITRPNIEPLFKLGIPMALCFAGGHQFGDNVDMFDHIFVESDIYAVTYLTHGYENVSVAFGTNTELFSPIPEQPKIYDTIFPATFASWKRHEVYAAATEGLKALAVGLIQDNGIDAGSWQECYKQEVMVLPHTSADVLHYLYAASKVCVVTSSSAGGSQRTVLEAMSMNIPLIITDSDKFDFARDHVYECVSDPVEIRGYIDALLDGEPDVNTRDYVIENWSEWNYANALEEGLNEII